MSITWLIKSTFNNNYRRQGKKNKKDVQDLLDYSIAESFTTDSEELIKKCYL